LPSGGKKNPRPDPQALAERFGGYFKVPVEEWEPVSQIAP
jgi:hypothetical protein